MALEIPAPDCSESERLVAMTNEEYSGPCRACGGEVYVRSVGADRTLSDVGAQATIKRVCRNRACPTNNPREKSLSDIV